MGLDFFLKPDWLIHAELRDQQEELERSSHQQSQSAHQEIADLRKQVRDLERQLLALEMVLAEKGIIETPPEAMPPKAAEDFQPVVFPTRTRDGFTCPRCGKQQQSNRDSCYGCQLPFRYEDEM